MALVECRECNAKISNEATCCPQCGCPNPVILKEEELHVKLSQLKTEIQDKYHRKTKKAYIISGIIGAILIAIESIIEGTKIGYALFGGFVIGMGFGGIISNIVLDSILART